MHLVEVPPGGLAAQNPVMLKRVTSAVCPQNGGETAHTPTTQAMCVIMVEKLHTPLPVGSSAAAKEQHYTNVINDIKLVLQDETDWVGAMATVSSILHHAFDYFHWTGFYCVWPSTQAPGVLVVGPYQGTLGCLRIPFSRGVCGAAARTQQTQLVPDVHSFEGHIACASSTQSEVVVPVVAAAAAAAAAGSDDEQGRRRGRLLAVLDVDSNHPAAFDDVDARQLEGLCSWLAEKYA